jgi:hypothetical protein
VTTTEDWPTDEGEVVCLEYTVRLFIPRKDMTGTTLNGGFRQYMDAVVDMDVLRRTPIGIAIPCNRCEWMAIDLTNYPHGLYQYGKKGELMYCPHCDGGEDIP